MNRAKSAAPVEASVDFAALAVLIDTAARLRPTRDSAGEGTPGGSPVASPLLRGADSMSAREYISARSTLARLVLQIKQIKRN